MRYYKLLSDTTFIGIASTNSFRKYQSKHNIILRSNEQYGSYIYCNGKLYRDSWMIPPKTNIISYEIADVIEISEDEYNALKFAIESNEEIETITQEEDTEETEVIENDTNEDEISEESTDVSLEFVKSSKIKEMSIACRKAITDGFDITLSDNISHHFSLTVQDQLNLLTISSEILSGETEIVYHADGEVCKYYSVEDATAIVNVATKHKTYHTTYYNSLKVYINSLDNITDISNIEYGVEIPEEYQSDILKSLIQENINDENNSIEDEESNAEVDDINNDSIVEDE